MDVCISFLYFDPGIFVLVRWLTPSQTSLNRTFTSITLEMELSIVLNSFAGAVKTRKPTGVPFLFELVAVVIQCSLSGYKPYATVFT